MKNARYSLQLRKKMKRKYVSVNRTFTSSEKRTVRTKEMWERFRQNDDQSVRRTAKKLKELRPYIASTKFSYLKKNSLNLPISFFLPLKKALN
jgi:hypothetical protein